MRWLKPVILAIWEAEIGGSWLKANPGEKLMRPPTQAISWAWLGTSAITTTARSLNRRIKGQETRLGKIVRSYSKNI
jgi:hypothetical protein